MKIHGFIRKSRILNWMKFDRQDQALFPNKKFPLESFLLFSKKNSTEYSIIKFSKNLTQKISRNTVPIKNKKTRN